MKTAPQPPVGKSNPILPLVEKIETFLRQAHAGGLPAHEVEQVVWQEILLIGHSLLQQFFDLHGSADAGETWTMPDGREVRRLKEPHAKIYQSVFGTFHLNRTVYAAREGQRIEFAPLDARLALPAGEYSYLLQDWAQTLAVEVSFAQAALILHRMLGRTVPVDSLERMNRRMAEDVAVFRESPPPPPPDEEGAILVMTADNKGVPMRRPADELPVGARRKKGEKANKKRMATLACVYTVEPKPRSAGDVIEALFRDRSTAPSGKEEEKAPQPKACNKRVMACLEPVGCEGASPQAEGFDWAGAEAASRWRDDMPVVCVMDGQVSLWNLAREKLGELKPVEILDLLHVVSRLWEAAYLFHAEGRLFDINIQSTLLIMQFLELEQEGLLLQSSVLNKHSKDHRMEIARALQATDYVAGRVEHGVMERSGSIEQMVSMGINVRVSPELDLRDFDIDVVERLSCVHAICTLGPKRTRELIRDMVSALKSA